MINPCRNRLRIGAANYVPSVRGEIQFGGFRRTDQTFKQRQIKQMETIGFIFKGFQNEQILDLTKFREQLNCDKPTLENVLYRHAGFCII